MNSVLRGCNYSCNTSTIKNQAHFTVGGSMPYINDNPFYLAGYFHLHLKLNRLSISKQSSNSYW